MRHKWSTTSLNSKRWMRPFRDEIAKSRAELQDSHAVLRGVHQATWSLGARRCAMSSPDCPGSSGTLVRHKSSTTSLNS